MWEVIFALDKTHAMMVSSSLPPHRPWKDNYGLRASSCLSRDTLRPCMGVTVDRTKLRYDTHTTSLASQTSQRESPLRRATDSLDLRGILTLYQEQICPCMDYDALTWMSSSPTHTIRLHAVQRQAFHLLGKDEEIATSITSLEHQRNVTKLTVRHKAWVHHTPHLTRLSLPPHPSETMTR